VRNPDIPLMGAERRIFRAVASVIVGRPAPHDVVDAAERFIARMSPADRMMFRLLLRIVEWGAPVLSGRPRRFTNLDPGEQRRYLRGWSDSMLKPRRQGFAALRALSMLGYYGREAAWKEVGYDGPWLGRVEVPVLPAPVLGARERQGDKETRGQGEGSGIRVQDSGVLALNPETRSLKPHPGVTRGSELRNDLHVRAEACVIGTGAGGAAALARLAERGVDVMAVEGGELVQAEDVNQRELDMFPLLFAEAGLRATADQSVGILQGQGVGGSTLHNTGLVVPPPRGIIGRWRAEHQFPLTFDQMSMYSDEAMRTLGAVPVPEHQINANNAILRRGAEAMAWRHYIPLHNRSECCGCGYCVLGCAYNRKNNAALTYIPRAVAAGARVLANAAVERIEGRAGAWRVVCRLQDRHRRPTGQRAVIESAVVMVGAGALDTPALLQRSGLDNRHVGRGLRLHPSPFVAATFPERIEAWRGLPQSVIIDEFASFYDDGHGGYLIIALAGWPGLGAVLAPGTGASHRELMRRFAHGASSVVLLHDETGGTVRRGWNGRPVARYWPNLDDRRKLLEGVRRLAELYLAAGAEEVRLPFHDSPPVRTREDLEQAMRRARVAPHRMTLNSVHPQGSCPLGGLRSRSATNPRGQLWGRKGLYVCDTSLFPTSVGVPPQVTTMALATMVADHVLAERPR
jgi:choline dehydrogenase-like flavoprotein